MDKATQKKADELKQLFEQQEEIAKKIAKLLNPNSAVQLPADFSVNEEVLKVVQDNPSGISAKQIFAKLQNQYPIERKQVTSALAYLKNYKKSVDIKERGVYVYVEETGKQ